MLCFLFLKHGKISLLCLILIKEGMLKFLPFISLILFLCFFRLFVHCFYSFICLLVNIYNNIYIYNIKILKSIFTTKFNMFIRLTLHRPFPREEARIHLEILYSSQTAMFSYRLHQLSQEGNRL